LDSLPDNSELTAVVFLANFIDAPHEEIVELDITKALSQLLSRVVIDTVELMNDRETARTLH
jgi:hypothetical protein|tara:strand:+ start:1147 stop:1332 length:186 start_codon:yes stop_codon:yes gene_type:complete